MPGEEILLGVVRAAFIDRFFVLYNLGLEKIAKLFQAVLGYRISRNSCGSRSAQKSIF